MTTEEDFATLKTMVSAGTVVAVGSNVSHVRPGRPVDSAFYMIAQGGLATQVPIPAAHACKLPSGLSPAEAASMAVAYVTALVRLDDVARVRPGRIPPHPRGFGRRRSAMRPHRQLDREQMLC